MPQNHKLIQRLLNMSSVAFGNNNNRWRCMAMHISVGHSFPAKHGAFSHFFRHFSTFGPMHQNVVTLGGGMCMLFEICEKTPFQKCMGWGG